MKTHVNVGTIGHVDHGKTTLTAALLAVQAQRGLAQVKTYGDIAKGGTVRHETKTVTIAISHVEYETAIEMFHKEQPEARAGENCGLLLRGVARDEVVRGQVLIAPGSVKSHTKAEAELYVISKEEGGRRTPIFSGYRPQFFFGTTDVTGAVVGFEDGMKMLVPGNHAKVSLVLHKPVGMEPGMRFAVREGGRTVGAGVILSVES